MQVHKLKAGTLLNALAIALLIGIISSSAILYSYYQILKFNAIIKSQKLRTNAESALVLLMSDQDLIANNHNLTFDLFGTGADSVQISRHNWGLLDYANSIAFHSKDSIIRSAFVGQTSTLAIEALYLADLSRTLSLCGKTKILGNCHLPKSGVKSAYIEGRNFEFDKLINGKIDTSLSSLPTIDSTRINQIRRELDFSNYDSLNSRKISYENIKMDSLFNSFDKEALFLYSKDAIIIDTKTITGKVIIKSEKSIIIRESSQLKDVILYAPTIIIKENTIASIQCFASDSLIIERNVQLKYPSSVGLLEMPNTKGNPVCSIAEKSKIEGAVIALKNEDNAGAFSKMNIEKNVTVLGTVYSTVKLNFKGKVFGTIYTTNFFYSTSTSIFENYLLDVEIDATKLPSYFVNLNLFENYSKRKVIKWI